MNDVVAEQVWSLSPAPVPVQVRIAGTYGQAGSVRIRMLWTPADPLGCGHADYRAATVVALGEAADVQRRRCGHGDLGRDSEAGLLQRRSRRLNPSEPFDQQLRDTGRARFNP